MATSIRHGFHIDSEELAEQFDQYGYALTPQLLDEKDSSNLIRMYYVVTAFRNRVVMERHNFGKGEYQYFADPIPEFVQQLRERLYVPLAEVANRWAMR